jgi:hypothetical protein
VSIEPNKHKPLSQLKVRAWVSQLLSRSILLGSSSGGVSMVSCTSCGCDGILVDLCSFQHDIIRDYTLAVHTPNELQQRQRYFCDCLIDTATNGEESVATASIRTYASTLLHFHVRGAAVIPLSNDALVQSWLLMGEQSDDIVYQVFQGVGSSNTNDLAIWFREEREYWSSAQLWRTLSDRTGALATKSQYYRNCIAVLAQIPVGTQPEKLEFEVWLNTMMSIFQDRQDERESATDWLLELADDPSKMHGLPPKTKSEVMGIAGATLLGFTNSKFADGSLNEIRRGARMYMQCSLHRVEYAVNDATGFMKWLFWGLAFDPYTDITRTYTCPLEMHDHALAVLGEGGVELVKWHNSYDFDFMHSRYFVFLIKCQMLIWLHLLWI